METTRKLYGAYGSNTNVRQMRKRCPGARVAGTGTLYNYRLTFRGTQQGVANVENRRGRRVPIVLWEITPECERALDLYEGFPRLYGKRTVLVRTSDGECVSAMIYVLSRQYEDRPAEPSGSYLTTIWQGYRDHGLAFAALRAALDENERELEEWQGGTGPWWKFPR